MSGHHQSGSIGRDVCFRWNIIIIEVESVLLGASYVYEWLRYSIRGERWWNLVEDIRECGLYIRGNYPGIYLWWSCGVLLSLCIVFL